MWSLNIFLLVGASLLALSYAAPAPGREGDNKQDGAMNRRRIFWWNNNLPKENADEMNSWYTLIGKTRPREYQARKDEAEADVMDSDNIDDLLSQLLTSNKGESKVYQQQVTLPPPGFIRKYTDSLNINLPEVKQQRSLNRQDILTGLGSKGKDLIRW